MKLSRVLRGTACSAVAVVGLTTLAACGGGSESAVDPSGTTTTAAAEPATGGGGMPGGGGGGPGASGEIAAVSGTTLQVQSETSGQVAVSWTGSTTFTEQVAGTLADVTVGSCVMVMTEEDAAATSVRITEATDDGCTGGFGGGGMGGGMDGERPEGMPTDLPADLPTDLPTDRPGGFGGTFGEVTAVTDGGFTVAGDDGDVEVTVDGATSYTTTADAQASDATVGRCASAVGEADDTGAVTATLVSLSDPVDGTCSAGRGLGGPPAAEDAS